MNNTEFLHMALDVVLEINGGVIERCGPGHPTAFFDYSGHTNCLYVSVHHDGWRRQNGRPDEPIPEPDRFRFNFDLHDEEELRRNFDRLCGYAKILKGRMENE